jgi:hypothetical protein
VPFYHTAASKGTRATVSGVTGETVNDPTFLRNKCDELFTAAGSNAWQITAPECAQLIEGIRRAPRVRRYQRETG